MAELIPNPSEIIKEAKNALPQTVEAIDHALSTMLYRPLLISVILR